MRCNKTCIVNGDIQPNILPFTPKRIQVQFFQGYIPAAVDNVSAVECIDHVLFSKPWVDISQASLVLKK